nr:MAG TPA: hypothetical protein [Caudoviricetes sp.]
MLILLEFKQRRHIKPVPLIQMVIQIPLSMVLTTILALVNLQISL